MDQIIFVPPSGIVPYLYLKIDFKFHLSQNPFLTTAAYNIVSSSKSPYHLSSYVTVTWQTSIGCTTSILVCYIIIFHIQTLYFPHLDHKCLKDRDSMSLVTIPSWTMATTQVWWMNGNYSENKIRTTKKTFLCLSSFLTVKWTKG